MAKEELVDRLIRIIGDLVQGHKPPGKFVVHFAVKQPVATATDVQGGTHVMPQLPPISVYSHEKQPVDLNPIAPGGTDVDETIVAVVSSSDPAQVGVEPDPSVPGGWFLTTPLDSGTATITISGAPGGPQMETLTFEFSYKPFEAGKWNPVFGAPVGDAVTP